MAVREGQYFILGALLIATFITTIIVVDVGTIHTPHTQVPKQLFDRAADEFPVMVNTALREHRDAEQVQQRLTTYLTFQQERMRSHGMAADGHTVLAVPDDGRVAVVVGNGHDAAMEQVSVTVDGTAQTINTLPSGKTRLLRFNTGTGTFPVTVQFDTADRRFNQSFTGSSEQAAALYFLRIAGENQVWQDTKTY